MIVKHLMVIGIVFAIGYVFGKVIAKGENEQQADANVQEVKRILNNKIKING